MSCEHNHSQMNPCNCCMSKSCGVTRREFIATAGAAGIALGTLGSISSSLAAEADYTPAPPKPLKVQPVLTIQTFTPRKQTSWRSWGGFHTKEDIAKEEQRIQQELIQLQKKSEFPLEILPLATINRADQAAKLAKGPQDVTIMYAANVGLGVLEALTNPQKWTIMFVRHKSGPVYLWYEIAHNRYLRKTVDEYGQPSMDYQDVVVDEYDDIIWRLRALYGLKNTLGKRIVAIGGANGWGAGGQKAPEISKNLWKMDIQAVDYKDLGVMIQKARQNEKLVKRCKNEAEQYLTTQGAKLETNKTFMENAFVLAEVFKDLMHQAKTDALTVNHCMGTIMPMSETTACMPLCLLNDSGYNIYCESDFVVIPSGILLHYISSKPVFLNDPTYPHHGMVTLAHCTAPRRMDGKNLEPVRILTHFESDYGAAPKVEMKLGEKMTVIDPDFDCKRWLGFEAEIIDNPFLDICRSQIDVQIKGDCDALVKETRGFHWMASYGDYLKETGYALKKVGVDWMNLTKKA
jgi:hypothetical protein